MAPNLINNKPVDKNLKELKKYNKIKKTITEYQKFIKNNFEYVGENFAYEARSIHYGVNKRKKNIFGTASYNEIKELKEEGIETETIIWRENKNN